MGLIRAIIITAIVYFVWKFVQESRWFKKMPSETQHKISPWIPIVLVFVIELLI